MNPNLKDISPNSSRRQILKTALTFVTGLTTTSLLSFLIPKSTKPAKALIPVQKANEFELKGEGIEIKYSVVNGVPQLDYKTEKISHNFSGDQIETSTTDGINDTLLTVIISRPPNLNFVLGSIVRLSLFLPDINLVSTTDELAVQAIAILATQQVEGNLVRGVPVVPTSYKTVVLKGTARYRR
ncbi:MAG: hypothetical protein V7L20_14465 [Nostoc sp.]|uniref:hypothetical protein n=1 Tax=Nostoc sp. TaxID=1180 RepID=UPI002FFAEDA8